MAAALALMMWGASPAVAGGPTSVLVVSPESRETASLFYSDAEYGRLERLLGPVGEGTRERPPEAVSGSARLINVTWMVHDVTPWRVDRVFVGLPNDAVWIHTASHVPESPNGFWHRADNPSDVYKFLFELGVMGTTTAPAPASGVYPAPWETAQAGPATDEGTAAAASETRAVPADSTDWWWVIPGVVAGAALALLLRPHVARLIHRRKDDPGPRQELLDV
ncbi:hypothetical protein ACFVZC_24315 [Streptomyces marokkonensis]|uniref:Secreted protein n=1 Tax=Streptomyces marokkonensis TaxID=324855 RepID=A0ABW6QBA5_9ACTN